MSKCPLLARRDGSSDRSDSGRQDLGSNCCVPGPETPPRFGLLLSTSDSSTPMEGKDWLPAHGSNLENGNPLPSQ